MTGISNISSGMILASENIRASKKMSADEMFKILSVMMGGDGKTITKKQLDDYIDKAASGSIKISDSGMKALKSIQANWDDIAGDGPLTSAMLKDYTALLTTAFAAVITAETSGEKTASQAPEQTANPNIIEDINSYLMNAALNFSTEEGSETSGLQSMLKTLLGGTTDENDDTNANLIASITNLIAASNSTISAEA